MKFESEFFVVDCLQDAVYQAQLEEQKRIREQVQKLKEARRLQQAAGRKNQVMKKLQQQGDIALGQIFNLLSLNLSFENMELFPSLRCLWHCHHQVLCDGPFVT